MAGQAVVRQSEVQPAQGGTRAGPRVSVLASLGFPGMSEHAAELITRFTRRTLEQCAALDLDWRLFDSSAPPEDAAALLEADALLVLGGGDVDTELYGVPGPAPHEYGVDRGEDDFAIGVINAAIDGGIPVLAVCRGAQLLNVAHGGSLIPDLDPWHLHHGDYASGLMIDEHVTLDEGTRLASILGAGEWTVRSGHHQAVAAVGEGLRRAAVSDDGVVEAVEHSTRWAIGVQWHPEDEYGSGRDLELLWAALADAARDHAAQRRG